MGKDLFWKLLEPHHPKAAAFCTRLVGDRDDGDDLYQDALLAAMRKFDTLVDKTAFRAWLYRIIVNRFKNRCRGWWWRQRVELSPSRPGPASEDDPEARLEARRELERLMAVLSPLDRVIVTLHEIEGWPTADLAAVLGKPEGTIKTRIFRAKNKMRARLRRLKAVGRATSHEVCEVAYAVQRSQKAAD